MTEDNQTLRTGNYEIQFSNGPSIVYKIEPNSGTRDWVCTCPDYEAGMLVVEGLILVENKRFYYPESKPTMKFDEKKPEVITKPNFLDRKLDN